MRDTQNGIRRAFSIFLALVGLSAFAGGIGLLSATDGSNMGFDSEMLEGSPFNDFLVPGLVLFFGVGGSNILASVMLWQRRRFDFEAAFGAGAVVFGWITIQVLIINELSWLHWLYWTVGLVTMGTALWLWWGNRAAKHGAGRKPRGPATAGGLSQR